MNKKLISTTKKLTQKLFGNKLTRFLSSMYKNLIPSSVSDLELLYIETMLKYIEQGDTVIDIGANEGLWTNALAKKVKENGCVWAFEPVESTFKLLKKNTRKYSNINLLKLGVSDKTGSETIVYDPVATAPPGASIVTTAKHISNTQNLIKSKIQLDTLDNVLLNKIEKVKFIKVDVEGHELNVIKGGIKTISKHKPILFMEILRENWINNAPDQSEVAKLLNSIGYKISQMQGDSVVDDSSQFDLRHENFLFTVQ